MTHTNTTFSKAVFIAAAAAVALAMAFGPAIAVAGNGAPQGAHEYQLNIIGTSVKNDKTLDDWGGNGARIFVLLDGTSKISLIEGLDFAVLDANGTDRTGAAFQMPKPGLDAYLVGDPGSADVVSDYSVFVRSLGKPGGWATITTCADVVDSTFGGLLTGTQLRTLNRAGEFGGQCSIEQVGQTITLRTAGQPKFSNVTAQLLTIVFDVEVWIDANGDGIRDPGEVTIIQVRAPIFDDSLANEYWEYDNSGLRLLQVRFYDCSTNVETGASTCN
jgi:hypothetical protein